MAVKLIRLPIATAPMSVARSRLLPALLCLALPFGAMADSADTSTLAIGAGVQRMPSWAGARTHRSDPIRGTHLHGGLYGDYQWGRDHDDLGRLAGKIPTLAPRATGGGYLEWDFSK